MNYLSAIILNTLDGTPENMGNPSKDQPWNTIFEKYDIHNHDFDKDPFYITAEQIKTACQDYKKTAEKEVRILCYQAQRKDQPAIFVEKGLFLLPVRNGKYAIMKGEGYVNIPEIMVSPDKYDSEINFPLETSKVGNSEMQHLDYAYAVKMIEHFVGSGKLYLTIRGRKYTPEFSFKVGSNKIDTKGVQTEVDAGFEGKDVVVLIEGKNMKMDNVIIRQLYYPYRKWSIETTKEVVTIFFEKRGEEYMFWMYEFTNPKDYNSIRLVKSQKYIMIDD